MFQNELVEYFLGLSMLQIAITFFKFQSKVQPNLMVLLRLFILTFWSFAQVFVFCDSSERLTSGFEEIDIHYLCDWYLFPIRFRRMLPTIITSTQKPVILEGFGNVMCTRELFKKVIVQ